MTIIEALKDKSQRECTAGIQINTRLLALLNEIVPQATEHLKLIIGQFPDYDLHDYSHSVKIIENIENLMGEAVISKLTGYELFLLYTSAFLHDCAMALPEWEIRLLKLTEGTEGFVDQYINNPIMNDLKAPYSLTEAIVAIEERRDYLYKNFDAVKDFVFIPSEESDFKKDLAERLIQYQEFRNGYIHELKKIISNNDPVKYNEFSEIIRFEYVRSTHSNRVDKFVRNMSQLFVQQLGGPWGTPLSHDLGAICKSHGEQYDFIANMEAQENYFGIDAANIQFVATMLRIGDILHFSIDRAPRSLFSEKMIDSKESIKHWNAKFQGVHYTLSEKDMDNKCKVKYIAYCDDPDSYYFIHEYMDWVDDEINNYFRFIHALDYKAATRTLVDKYKINIAEKVDRSQIKFNSEKFTPVIGMGFSLNQRKVIDLLMGVGLYKNKYLCFRELYQNAMDACKCMIFAYSSNSITIDGKIEFGIKEQHSNGRTIKYLYCKDNGLGMTRNIIENYFLNIGTSYYGSKEFNRMSVKWQNSFKPTSQFGIGILSSFMIGKRIEITTIPLIHDLNSGDAIRFSIDGPHEHFYFMQPDQLEVEELGAHGTLVKVFLNDDEALLNNMSIDRFQLFGYGQHCEPFKKKYKDVYLSWNTNIFKLLSDSIGKTDPMICLNVKFSDGGIERLRPGYEPLDLLNLCKDEEEFRLLFSHTFYIDSNYNPINDYLQCFDFIENSICSMCYEGIEYEFALSLPKPNIPIHTHSVLKFSSDISNRHNRILIDGISVQNTSFSNDLDDATRSIFHNGVINFVGIDRPQLSIDRNSIIETSDILKAKLNKLPEIVGMKLIETVEKHFSNYGISFNSKEADITWDYIFRHFTGITQHLLEFIVKTKKTDLIDKNISKMMGEDTTICNFTSSEKLSLKEFNFLPLDFTSQLLIIGKMADAEYIAVKNANVDIKSSTFTSIKIPSNRFAHNVTTFAIRADEWLGSIEEYDIVSNLWPVVPSRLFDNLTCDYTIREITARTKMTSEMSNAIAAIAHQDPVLVHPKLGFFSNNRMNRNKNRNSVMNFDSSCGEFWMFELNNHGEKLKNNKDNFVYAFIAPRELNDEEQTSLESCRYDEPLYYEGIKNGWSVLFLGKTAEMVIMPGIMKRSEIMSRIKKVFWEKNCNIEYSFLDGTIITAP